MKNKKGFTLIELLSVIILIGLLVGIGVPGISKISSNMKKKSLNTKINLVEQAGVLYGQDNKALLQTDAKCKLKDKTEVPCKKISINQLIKEGYLDSEEHNDVKFDNPTDNSSMLGYAIYVYKKNNRVYAEYSEELLIQMIISDGIKSGDWHTAPFTITLLGSGEIKYSWDNLNFTPYTEPLKIEDSTESTMLYASLYNGIETIYSEYEIKLDLENPTITEYKIFYDQINNEAVLSGNASDDLSLEYKFDITCDGGGYSTITTKELDISTVKNNTYYFCVKDPLGNISSTDANLGINIVAPNASGVLYNNNFNISVSGTGSKTCKYDGSVIDCNTTITSSNNPSTFVATLKDGIKINEINYQVNLDKYPEIQNYDITYDTSNSVATLTATAKDDKGITRYAFSPNSNCSGTTWEEVSAGTKTINVSHRFNNLSEQNKDYYFCVEDSREQKTYSSKIFVANCKVDVTTYTCSQELTNYLIFFTKWKSSFVFNVRSYNQKKLYIKYDIKDDLFSYPSTFNHELETNTITTNNNARLDYKDGCDSEDEGLPIYVYLNNDYETGLCYHTIIYRY